MTDYLERDDGTKMPVGHLPVPKGDVAVRGQTFHGKRIVVEAHGQGRAPHKRERFVLHEYVETITTAPDGTQSTETRLTGFLLYKSGRMTGAQYVLYDPVVVS